jgi:hypothetical protein
VQLPRSAIAPPPGAKVSRHERPKWFAQQATQHAKFDVEAVDLKEVNLPLLDEPNHPMKWQYRRQG